MKKYGKPLIGIILQVLALVLAYSSVQAQGGNLVYIDSVVSGPGQDVTVRFNLKNSDTIASLSVPITYDTSILTLKSLSFTGTRIAYLGNKLTTPQTITQANGHFIVAAFRIMEPSIPVGDGPVFSVTFSVAASATSGIRSTIDSLFYPPGGSLLLVEAGTARSIRPAFRAGLVTVSTRPPVFAALADQAVLEGDTLKLDVSATDPNGQKITLSLTSKPTGATLIDNGNGTGRVVWAPDFVGPNSADMSPFAIGIRATNGTASTDIAVHVTVINRDRAPLIAAASSVQVQAGQPLSFGVSATDADFDPITWKISGLPAGATFDNKNPGRIDWTPAITDSGSRVITVIASDPIGFSDTAIVTVNVAKTVIYSLTLDTLSADPNTSVDYYVRLDNKLPVSSFRVLFNYDPSVLTLLGVTKVGTRSAGWSVFDVTTNAGDITGNLRIVGSANGAGQTGNPPLAPGNGPIVKLTFRVSGNIIYAGQYLPVRFQYLDAPINNDNTLGDSAGVKITQGQIAYQDGSVLIKSVGRLKIGDVNLNGMAYEISDVIYFTNFFIDPVKYPFNALQYANSDVNGDHLLGTIADLVTLINAILGGSPAAKLSGETPAPVELSLNTGDHRAVVQSSSTEPVAGLFITFKVESGFDPANLQPLCRELTVISRQDGDTVRLLLYDINGGSLPAGTHELVGINATSSVEITKVTAASIDGRLMVASISTQTMIPDKFSLEQNYPNPFNPETQIRFALPGPANVRLTIYNLLGEEVVTLAEGAYPAGTQTVVWRGIDRNGQSVASGVYLYRLEADASVLTRKMMLVK
ncbi:MAG: T9SS type A sorting domain-containing protein [candidate division Zixibacteria bacterium]|nr:T9SS type A sorting domain-containing protein [candidate division Zixibacteria bacterium]